MPKGLRKPTEETPLEGGGAGSGAASSGVRGIARRRLEAMMPQERAALENPGKQFESPKPAEAKPGQYGEKTRARLEAMTPQERAEVENIGEQFRIKPTGMKRGGSISTSKRGDGCAQRGKTKGRMI